MDACPDSMISFSLSETMQKKIDGLFAGIIGKVSAMTALQYINYTTKLTVNYMVINVEPPWSDNAILTINCLYVFVKIHIGKEIRAELHRQGKSVSWLETELHMQHPNICRIFQSPSYDTDLLFCLFCILHTDFFRVLSRCIKDDTCINSDTEC